MRLIGKARFAVTAGLCVAMTLGGTPVAALAEMPNAGQTKVATNEARWSRYNVSYKDSIDSSLISQQNGVEPGAWNKKPGTDWGFQNMYRKGFSFSGWTYDKEGTRPVGEQLESQDGSSYLTLWAQWVPADSAHPELPLPKQVYITYKDSVGGSVWATTIDSAKWNVDPTSSSFHYGNSWEAPAGKKFAGWAYDEAGERPVEGEVPDNVNGKVTLYAQWKSKFSSYNVTYRDSLDATFKGSHTGCKPDAWDKEPGVDWEVSGMYHKGMSFAGWTYDEAGERPVEGLLESETKDVTLWAQWVKADADHPETPLPSKLNVTYKDPSGTNGSRTVYSLGSKKWDVDPLADFDWEAPAGKKFAGWAYDEAGERPVEGEVPDNVNGKVTLYAQWKSNEPIPDVYKVTFKDRFAGTETAVEVKEGEAVEEPTAPSYEGYTFVGWSSSDEKYVPYDFSKPVAGDLTLYASYSKNAGPSDDEKPGENPGQNPGQTQQKPQVEKDEKKSDDKALPQTGDNSAVAIAGAALAGAAVLAAGVTMKRRQN